MVNPPFTQDRHYLIRVISDGYVTVGRYDATFMTGRGGVFWICGNDDPYISTEVQVSKEIDTTW
jgi:hypothetical protein